MKNIINVDVINNYLKENKMTKKELCEKSKISIGVLYKILANKNFSIVSIFKLAKTIDIRVCEMFKSN